MTYINGISVIAIGVLFPVLDSLAVAGRFYSRIKRNTRIGVDDWICIPALALTVALGVVLVYGAAQETIGYHTTVPTSREEARFEKAQVELLRKLEIVYQCVGPLAIGLIKLAILLCYRRIFADRVFVIINWSMVALVITWTFAFTITSMAACGKHIQYLWGSYDVFAASCINTYAYTVYMGVTDFVIDILILTQPLPWVWRLRLTLSKKLAVTSVFLLGLFATVAAVTRTAVIVEINNFDPNSNGTIFGLSGSVDELGINSVFFFWSYIEIGIAMGICCAPALRTLVEQLSLESVLSTIRASSPFGSRKTPSAMSTWYGKADMKSCNSSEQHLVLGSTKTAHDSEDLEMQSNASKPSIFRLQRDRQNHMTVVKDTEAHDDR